MYVNIFLGYMKCGNNLFLANILAKFVNQHNIQARSFDKKWPPGVKLMGMQHSILHLLSWSQAAKTAANTKQFCSFLHLSIKCPPDVLIKVPVIM